MNEASAAISGFSILFGGGMFVGISSRVYSILALRIELRQS